MSSKPRREDKPKADPFSEALARIERARKTGATELTQVRQLVNL